MKTALAPTLEVMVGLGGIGALSFVLSLLGAAVGMVLGHVRLPLLVAYLGSPVVGASTNLAISGLGALAGAIRHARAGRVSLTVLACMGIPSAIGAASGMLLFIKLNRFWAHVGLGMLLLFLGIRMARATKQGTEQASAVHYPGIARLIVEAMFGLLLGALAAVSGLMMNSLRLPVLLRLLGGNVEVAIGSNMAIGLLTALVGVGTAWAAGSPFDLLSLAVVGCPTVVGSYLGAALTGRMRRQTLQRLLGWVIAVTGLLMVFQGLSSATRPRDLQPPPHTPIQARELKEETDEWPEEP